MKLLITGSEGFVGSMLVEKFLQLGYNVIGIDRVKTSMNNYEFHKLDMVNNIKLYPTSYDLVIHCAAAKGDWNISNVQFYQDNITATQNLITYLRKCNINRIIHFSTVAIYSRISNEQSERAEIKPDSIYGQTKLDSELLMRDYAIKAGIQTTILRPSVIYGPNNYANMFNLIKQLDSPFNFQINPNGIIKSHVSVRNVVDVVVRFSDFSNLLGGIEIFNLTERPYNNLNSLIKIICDELGVNQPKINLPIWLVAIPFGILQLYGTIVKKDTGFTLDRLRKFTTSTHYTSEKLWTQIGIQKYSTDSQIRDMVRWYKSIKD